MSFNLTSTQVLVLDSNLEYSSFDDGYSIEFVVAPELEQSFCDGYDSGFTSELDYDLSYAEGFDSAFSL